MTETRTSRLIKASPEKLYAAFIDPVALLAWLPPAPMTGRLHAFDAQPGGGYRLSLFYPSDERRFQGKTAEREDRIDVRFVELVPARRIVEAVTFDTADPALQGDMTITVTFEPMDNATNVTFHFTDLPPGVRPEDNEEGTRLSLEQLARYVSSP